MIVFGLGAWGVRTLVGETVSAGLLGRDRRRINEAALAALLEATVPDDAAIAHHAAAAGSIDVMLAAVQRAATDALRRGTAYQALELAELGLNEAPADSSLKRTCDACFAAGRSARRRR